jgi:hypothetical protein
LTLSVRTPTEAALGTLRDAVAALVDLPTSCAAEGPPDVERSDDEGAPSASTPTPYPMAAASVSRGRLRRRPTYHAHAASPAARDVAYAALGAYACALRDDGLSFPAALVALGTAVDEAANGAAEQMLPPALLAAVQRDATQCCRAVFASP